MLEQKKYIETKYGGEIIFLEVDGKEISSTYIRELINKNLPVEEFLSKGVLNIVKQKELYINSYKNTKPGCVILPGIKLLMNLVKYLFLDKKEVTSKDLAM